MRERSCSSMNPFSGCISSASLRVSLNSSSSLSASRWWPSNGHSIARMWTFTPFPTFPTEVFAPIVAKDAWMALLRRISLLGCWANKGAGGSRSRDLLRIRSVEEDSQQRRHHEEHTNVADYADVSHFH